MLTITNLNVKLDDKEILKNISLKIDDGEIHLLMGPNGAGKSTLVRSLMNYEDIDRSGKLLLDGEDITDLDTTKLAQKGIFMAYQHPVEIPGVHFVEFIRTAYNIQHPDDKFDPWTFREMFDAVAKEVGLPYDFNERNLNEGFSGGEKKKAEIVQMLLLRPEIALLDEIDSGLDVDSLSNIFAILRSFVEKEQSSVLVITHNPNILTYLKPDKVHILKDGQIAESGDAQLVKRILDKGFNQK